MNTAEIICTVLDCVILGFLSYTDIKRKEVNIIPIITLGVINAVFAVFFGEGAVFLVTGMIPGTVAVLVSFVTRGKFGMGDGLILIALGLLLGIGQTFWVWFLSLCFAALAGMVLILFKKAGFKTSLPFVPFLFLGFVLCRIGG